MTTKKGAGLLMVWAEVPSDREKEFNRWYNEEHLAERLALPGFLSAARYEAVKGGPKHLACYELESAAVLESEAYTRLRTHLTEWTRRSAPEVSESAAWAAQRDISPVTHRIRPHMRHAPGSPGIWVKTLQL